MNGPQTSRSSTAGRRSFALSANRAVAAGAVLLALLAFLLGRYAAAQDLAGERVLWQFDALFARGRAEGMAVQLFLYRHMRELGLLLSAWLAFVVLLAHGAARRRAWPVSLACVGLLCAGWGEILVLQGQPPQGGALLAAGFLLMLLLGALRPLVGLQGFPPPPEAEEGATAAVGAGELACLAILLIAALLARTYALNELPHGFDGEALNDMIMSRTPHGLREFLRWNFLANATGALQLLSQGASYRLFGTSIFSLRYSVAVLGSVAVLLFYALTRRYAGARPALLAAALAAFAPEQLYWSRFEVTHFLVAVLAGLVTLLLCQAMLRRLGPVATLATALWMPFSRLLYIAGWVLFALPPVAAMHSLLLGTHARRKAFYVLPILALGVVLWGAAPSLLRWTFVDSSLPFVPPANVYGHSFVSQQGQLHETSTASLLRAQAISIAAHAREAAVFFFDRCDRFTHWYVRGTILPENTTVTDAALAVWAFCGLFYLLAQWRDARAVLLWALFAFGAAPALMSPIPFARRMLLVFVTLPIAAALVAAAVTRLAEGCGAWLAAQLLRAGTAVALCLVAVTSAQSYYMLPVGVSPLLAKIRFARPLFAADDAIFHNLSFGENGNPGLGVAFGNLDAMLARDVDFQLVPPGEWLAAALHLQPRYEGYLARLTLDEARRAQLAAERRVEHAAFLFSDAPESAAALRLVGQLYPHAERRAGAGLISLSIDADAAARRRTPHVAAAPGGGGVLRGFAVTGTAASAAPSVAAGVLVAADDWYRWRLDPPCAEARLEIDGAPLPWMDTRPLLRGVHALALSLPASCATPVSLTRLGAAQEEAPPLGNGDLLAPDTAALEALRPRPAEVYAGVRHAEKLVELEGRVIDFAVDGNGGSSVLVHDGGGSAVLRLAADGTRRSSWQVDGEEPAFSLAVADDGTHAVLTLEHIRWYGADGSLLASTPLTAEFGTPMVAGPACEIVFWGPDRLLMNHPGRNAILVLDRTGAMVAEWKIWPGLEGELYEPWSLASDGRGRLLVRDNSRRAFVVESPTTKFAPRTTAIFPVDAVEHGACFASRDRIVVPAEHGFEVFRADGTRLIARQAERDLGNERFGAYPRARAVGDLLYALDAEAGVLWRIAW